MHRDHVPERGIDRVELGLLAGIGKAVRQHALGDRIGPGEQDRARQIQPVGQGHEAAQRDEGVAPPVGEPGIAGNDGLALAALHDVGIGALLLGRSEAPAALRLHVEQEGGVHVRRGLARAQHHRRLAAVEGPAELARRGEILDEVEAALALGIVLEVAVPLGLVAVRAVGHDRDRRNALVGSPEDARTGDLGGEREARVLVVQRVVVAAREQRPDAEAGRAGKGAQAPAQHDVAAPLAGDDLLGDLDAVLGAEGPLRPGSGAEIDNAYLPVRVDDVRGIALRAQREAAGRRLQPDLEAVDQDDAPGRRRGRGEQQRVVAPGPNAAHGAGGEAALAIGLEPLGLEQGGLEPGSGQASGQGFGHRLVLRHSGHAPAIGWLAWSGHGRGRTGTRSP